MSKDVLGKDDPWWGNWWSYLHTAGIENYHDLSDVFWKGCQENIDRNVFFEDRKSEWIIAAAAVLKETNNDMG